MRGRVYAGSTVLHGSRCACPLCDPADTKRKAQRERFLAEQKARAAAPPPAPMQHAAGARRVVVRQPERDDTRRFAELLRGPPRRSVAEAIEIIEVEKAQRKKEES